MRQLYIGSISLSVPDEHPLSDIYTHIPSYGSELGRLASCISRHKPDAVIVDVGANIGDTAALVKMSGRDLQIYCFEGDDKSFEFLEANSSRIGLLGAYKVFLNDKTVSGRANIEKSGWNATVLPGDDGSTQIDFSSLDDFWPLHVGRKIDLLKIDTEGFDCRIIRGCSDLLKVYQPALMFEYNRDNMDLIGEDGKSIFPFLLDIGYSKILIYEAAGRYMLSTHISNYNLLDNLHAYIGGGVSAVKYFDFCVFHESAAVLANEFEAGEQAHREISSNNLHSDP